jgi:hypothetical protein
VLASEHLLRLACLDFSREIVERAGQIVADRLAGPRPFDQYGQVVDAPAERFAEAAILLEAAPALKQLLGRRLVLPEIWRGYTLFDVREFFVGAGCVKDGSADRRRGGSGRRTCEADRRIPWPRLLLHQRGLETPSRGV